VRNFALNAQQNSSGLTFSPAIEYNHSTGLTLSYNNSIVINSDKSGVIQHSISPGFLFSKNKRFDFGVYYTYFKKNKSFSNLATPYNHDAYGFLTWNARFLQPSVSFGYSLGNYNEFTTTSEKIQIPRPLRGDTTIPFTIYDSLKVKIVDFSSSISVRKRFIFEGKKTGRYIVFNPSVLALFVQNNYDVNYKSVSAFSPRTQIVIQNRPQLAEILRRQLNKQFPGLNQTRGFLNTSDFVLQSVGVNLDLTGYVGKFYINPRVYFDYYLLSSENKFNAYFSLQTGVFIN
jgi:hypothetical protein